MFALVTPINLEKLKNNKEMVTTEELNLQRTSLVEAFVRPVVCNALSASTLTNKRVLKYENGTELIWILLEREATDHKITVLYVEETQEALSIQAELFVFFLD